MIDGEFDLSIGSMIGLAGMSMASMMIWGFQIRIPFTETVLLDIGQVSPTTAILLTLCMTLSFCYLIGNIVVRSKLPSFIVTLGFLFFLRGLTEVCYRFLNRAPGERSGSAQVSDLPDFKNLISLEPYRDMLSYARTEAVQLAQGSISVFQRPLNNNLATAEQHFRTPATARMRASVWSIRTSSSTRSPWLPAISSWDVRLPADRGRSGG